jgi:hypothetical protein
MINLRIYKEYYKGNWWLIFETSPRVVHKRNSSIILSDTPLPT